MTDKMKYGSGNCSITQEGTDIIIRVDAGVILHKAGTLNKAGAERKVDLVATSGGFMTCGACRVSLNVTA